MENLEQFKKNLNEALDNYHDIYKWESFLSELEECYEYGAHTEAYIEICKFFKYDDLLEIFLKLKQYRDENNGYDIGSPESDQQYETFKIMMNRLESEIPNQQDFEEIRQYL